MAVIIHEGWVLKKRRKKMQGFARRYFTLHDSGLLSYAFEPGQPVRDQIILHDAAISTALGRKDVHIDSSTATFHIRCLSTDDFNSWMSAFRKFISVGMEARKTASLRVASRKASLNLNLNRTGTLLEEMGNTVDELENAISLLSTELAPTKVPSLQKKHGHSKESMFGLFKRPQHHHSAPETPAEDFQDTSRPSIPDSLLNVATRFDVLKAQYTTLAKIMQESLNESAQQMPSLPMTAEEEETLPAFDNVQRTSTPPTTRKSFRDSITTTSDSLVEWFDAVDEGPQEFIMEVCPEISEPGSRLLSASPEDTSSIDTDVEEPAIPSAPLHESIYSRAFQVIRRTQLPCPAPGDEASLFAILKKNVGKDLSTITFPVTFNEPLTMLQRAAEEVEYYRLLDEAAQTKDPVARISYVAAFAISGYAHTRHRSGRKGFNPMLAETFEDIRMRFIAEKVRHNPLEIAYHAEGQNWELNATSCGRTKFWGKSLEIIPLGTNRLRIGSETYVWKKPSSFMRNLMVGTKYFEHVGKMIIENTTSQFRCVVDFKQNGYWGPTNVVSGTVHDSSGDVVSQIEGKWDDQISQMLDESHFHVLWKMSPFPKNSPDYYGFTSYGITLNELTSDLVGKLPPTDSRLRPDVRALENAEVDLAEEEKLRVERMQRDRRNTDEERQPRWFKEVGDEWLYIGGYWEARSRGWIQETISPLW
ncbi:oxysterol binding protein [Gymnopilus junonius]|uniref:Oxysterol binding protein n=1 Tax=Gymnopilus junonius TaxID=109634 RepID=A0A9P5TTL3_GYMJU|nr:oxysterol binding protein [Gymnopilus junonius]